MYDPTAGKICLGSADFRSIDPGQLREQISYVPQDGFLFSDTVADNIAFGLRDVDRGRIEDVAEKAAVHDDIVSFPSGYDTMVGERGVMLSGGQKQRISIARALARKAPLLILDDSLSAVDARTEKKIISNIRAELENRTTIIVTHKILSVLAFDRIVVMEEGRIAEMGRHDELLQLKGLYAEMYQRQQVQEVQSGV
jgi:ATP-binding cassette subfamily B protein